MTSHTMAFQLLAAGTTDVGKVRTQNEDFWGQLEGVGFAAAADGMGGHQAGEVASREAVQGLCRAFHDAYHDQGSQGWAPEEASALLPVLIQDVNRSVFRRSREDAALRGMGTTLVCVYLTEDRLVYAHVGDSRIYRWRRGKLKRLTRDDSLLSDLIEQGVLTESDHDEFLYKNIITKAIGLEPNIEPMADSVPVESGDLYILCTDGLTDMLHDAEIQSVISQRVSKGASAWEMSQALVQEANNAGGQDNITVVIAQVLDA